MAIKPIENYAKPAKVNPYVEDLKDQPIGFTFEVEVETRVSESTGKILGLTGEKGAVQEAARLNGKTARIQETRTISEPKVGEPGKTVYVFQLFALQESSPRKPKDK